MVYLPEGDWVTVADAAEIIGAPARRVQEFIVAGELKAVRVGARVYLILRTDAEAFVKVERRRGRPPKGKPKKKGKRK